MTIQKGVDWGERCPLPPEGVVVRSDAEARAVVEAARRAGEPVPPLGLLGGDLCRTLGGSGDAGRLRSAEAMSFPCDLGSVLVEGSLHWFVAHLVARRGWWRGRAVVAANAAWLGRWNVAPRCHPNDGILEVLDARVPTGERAKVRARLPLGDHLPHPAISVRRVKAVQIELERSMPVFLDGVELPAARNLSIRCEPDALTVFV